MIAVARQWWMRAGGGFLGLPGSPQVGKGVEVMTG